MRLCLLRCQRRARQRAREICRAQLNDTHTLRSYTAQVVRSASRLDPAIARNPLFEVAEAEITATSVQSMGELLRDCRACVCCLGHNLSFEGIYGPPARLVADAAALVCDAAAGVGVSASASAVATSDVEPFRLVLLSSAGVDNPDGSERALRSPGERAFLMALAALLPPQADNVEAARVVADASGSCAAIERVIVRPDDLLEGVGDAYVASPTLLNGIFDAKVRDCSRAGSLPRPLPRLLALTAVACAHVPTTGDAHRGGGGIHRRCPD